MFGRHGVPGVLASLLAMVLAAGCSSSSRGEKVFEGFQRTQTRLAEADKQVDKVLADMSQFQFTGDMNSRFKNYKASVAKLEEQYSDAKSRSQAMQQNADRYIEDWQKEMEKVSDPTIKASLEQRREAVRANFTQIRTAAEELGKAYEPFIKDNQEIVKALSIDLSPGALPGLKPAMGRASANGKIVKQKIAALQKTLSNTQSGMTASK